MAEQQQDVRAVGAVHDFDGCLIAVGVDHDLVTLGTPDVPGAWARLDRPQRVALFRLLQDAVVVVTGYEAAQIEAARLDRQE